MTIHTAPDCSCADAGVRHHLMFPENYYDDERAFDRFVLWRDRERKCGHYLYWAVHLRGEHVLSVAS